MLEFWLDCWFCCCGLGVWAGELFFDWAGVCCWLAAGVLAADEAAWADWFPVAAALVGLIPRSF